MGKVAKYTHTCTQCSSEFTSVNPIALTCSSKCRSARYGSVHHNLFETRTCVRCKAIFSVTGKQWSQRFCSVRCRKIDEKYRYGSDIQNIIKHRLRCRLNDFITGQNINITGCIRYLGCSMKEFIKHLESKFYDGMSWDNYGYYGWHIDHILPLASFDLTDPEQLKRACHYTNLQPLWAKDNLVKSNKIINHEEK